MNDEPLDILIKYLNENILENEDETFDIPIGFELAFMGVRRKKGKLQLVFDYKVCIYLLMSEGSSYESSMDYLGFNLFVGPCNSKQHEKFVLI